MRTPYTQVSRSTVTSTSVCITEKLQIVRVTTTPPGPRAKEY